VYCYTSGTLNGLHGMIGTVNGTLNCLHGTIETENGTVNGLHGTIGTVNGMLNGLHGMIRTENDWNAFKIYISETLTVFIVIITIYTLRHLFVE
jgi:sugar phosphate permease